MTTSATPLPERLIRLNQELAVDRKLDFDNDLCAVRGEHKFKISVFRNGNGGFSATTKAEGRVLKYDGLLPSDAYLALVSALKVVVRRLDHQKAEAEFRASIPSTTQIYPYTPPRRGRGGRLLSKEEREAAMCGRLQY